jgi:hypothetical protein
MHRADLHTNPKTPADSLQRMPCKNRKSLQGKEKERTNSTPGLLKALKVIRTRTKKTNQKAKTGGFFSSSCRIISSGSRMGVRNREVRQAGQMLRVLKPSRVRCTAQMVGPTIMISPFATLLLREHLRLCRRKRFRVPWLGKFVRDILMYCVRMELLGERGAATGQRRRVIRVMYLPVHLRSSTLITGRA